MSTHIDLRIAWLTPGWGFSKAGGLLYWESVFAEFQRACPNLSFITTKEISPYYSDMFNVRSIGRGRWKKLYSYGSGYGVRGFALLSPAIAPKLLKLKPQLVISTGFTLWTIIAALLKKIGRWKLLVLWDGCSPTIDAVDDPVRMWIRKFTSKSVDAFISNSIEGTRYFGDTMGIPKERVFRTLYLVPDIKALTECNDFPAVINEGQRPRFLYAGQLIPRKGIKYLLTAWSKLQDLSPRPGSLWIVGDGVQKDELIKQAHTLGLRDVHFVGRVEYASLGFWYQACDVFVFPTLEDIWGMVVPEAMAFGKSILCSQYAGAAELVRHGENGFIFDPRNPDEIAQSMLELIKSPNLMAKFERKSRDIMRAHTSSSAVAALREVIEHVTAQR